MHKEQQTQTKIRAHEWIELFFDSGYLLFMAASAVIFLRAGANDSSVMLLGCLITILGGGDAFHLLPRIGLLATGQKERLQPALGIGKLVTSITMTVVYLLLFYLWRQLYPQLNPGPAVEYLLWFLAAIRILLCLCKQNRWTKGESDRKWPVIRNVPFIGIGLIMMILYIWSGFRYPDGFRFMGIAIFLSFGFYLPVALGNGKRPALGALMLPKTIMYIWMVIMGYSIL